MIPESYEACKQAAYEAFAAMFREAVSKRLHMAGYDGSGTYQAAEGILIRQFDGRGAAAKVEHYIRKDASLILTEEENAAPQGLFWQTISSHLYFTDRIIKQNKNDKEGS